jgi:hypothetical protein
VRKKTIILEFEIDSYRRFGRVVEGPAKLHKVEERKIMPHMGVCEVSGVYKFLNRYLC